MTSAIDLDFIRDAAAKKYAGTPVAVASGDPVELANPLRLPKEQRKAISDLKTEDFDDEIDYFEAIFALASSEADAKRIRETLGEEDATLHATLLEIYMKGSELGEASPSQD